MFLKFDHHNYLSNKIKNEVKEKDQTEKYNFCVKINFQCVIIGSI